MARKKQVFVDKSSKKSSGVYEDVRKQLMVRMLNKIDYRVYELLQYPFLRRSLEVKRKIVAAGRPAFLRNTPMWSDEEKDGRLVNDANFRNPALYEQVHWLVRCDKRRKFFCYNCLLYDPSNAMLMTRLFADFPTLLNCAQVHEITDGHMVATVQLQMFIKDNFPTSVRSAPNKTQHNLIVKRNREILKRLIDAIYCVVGQKHCHGDGKDTHTQITVDDCAKFLELMRKVDTCNADLIDGAADMMKKNPRIVNDLVDAITRVVKTAIKIETQQSTYVSVILSEHGMPHKSKSQISSVLRYIKRGKVCERFIGFINFIDFNSSQIIYNIVLDVIKQYDIDDRFLALSLDGKVLPKEELTNLVALVKINYQFSYFVPWHSHGFGNTLLQTLTESEECGLFLKNIEAMKIFFENPKPRESFEFTLLSSHTELRAHYKWYKKAPFIVFVATYRNIFIEFFDGVIKNCKYWETDDIANILSFRGFLQEVSTVFFLQVFKKIFTHSFDETFNFAPELGKEMFVFDNPKIAPFKKSVGNLRFQPIWEIVVTEAQRDSTLAAGLKKRDMSGEFDTIFHKILRNLYKEIDIRTNYLSRLKFCDLLNCNSKGQFVFSPQLLTVLMTEHGPFFNEIELLAEVEALNAQPVFQNKSVHELLETFADLNLRSVLPQLYKLAEFILTLPFLPASRDGVKSKLRDINQCSFIPQNAGLPSGEASFLCVEYELLDEVKESPLFYDDVLARFYEVNNYLLLMQI